MGVYFVGLASLGWETMLEVNRTALEAASLVPQML